MGLSSQSSARIRYFQVADSINVVTQYGVSGKGDFNRDGISDVTVGNYTLKDGNSLQVGGIDVYCGKTGLLINRFLGSSPNSGFGRSLAVVDDTDKDNTPDILVGAPNDSTSQAFYVGIVRLISGKTGKVLRSHVGTNKYGNYGAQLCYLGDLTGDKVGDYAIWEGNPFFGYNIYDGKSGGLLARAKGTAITACGDLDRDGVLDFVVGDQSSSAYATNAGMVTAYSWTGQAMIQLYAVPGKAAQEGFGRSVAGVGDLDGDSYPDVIAGASYDSPALVLCGYAALISGKKGQVVHYWKSNCQAGANGFSAHLGSVQDWDGDGVEDVYISDPANRSVYIYSGKSFNEIRKLRDETDNNAGFPVCVAGVEDVNGDLLSDVALITHHGSASQGFTALQVFSGGLNTLIADRDTVSIAKEETQTYSLDARSVNAGKIFIIVGSMTGTMQGLQLDRIKLPLAWDYWSWLTVAYPNGALYPRSLGVLNPQGKAVGSFQVIKALPASMIGLELWHAYVVMDPKGGTFDLASNAVKVKVLP